MTNQIQKIHNSDVFGIFIEMGLGNPVSSKLCEIPGASQTVFCAENPYNDNYSRKQFGINERIVSLEAVQSIMNSSRVYYLMKEDSRINTVFVSSFQIGDINDKKSTHGYIGLRYKDEIRYYHVSIHFPSGRQEYIQSITETCLNLLEMKKTKGNSYYIDAVWDSKMNPLYHDTFDYLNKGSRGFTYIQNGNLLRLEDLLRSAKEGLIIYKGSFNPITNAHLKLMNEAHVQFPNYKTVFSISLDTFDKGIPKWDNLQERIRLINKLGHSVLLYQNGLFDSMHYDLMHKYDKEIVYVMGADTANRYLGNSTLWMKNRKFIVFDRNKSNIKIKWENENDRLSKVFGDSQTLSEVSFVTTNFDDSSTKIRNAIKTDTLNEVKSMVPTEIFNDLVGNNLISE